MGCGVGKGSKNIAQDDVIPVESRPVTEHMPSEPAVAKAAEAVVASDVEDLKFRVGQFIQYHNYAFYQDYRTVKELGRGAYGNVYLAEHRVSKQKRAIKEIDKAKADKVPGGKSKFIREVEILAKLDHPNILKLYELYEDTFRYYVVSELLTGGELFDYIVSSGHLSEAAAAHIMEQILSAVRYCHENHIVHRDLKPENLLLESMPTSSEEANIKLIDFGTSSLFTSGTNLRQRLGTPYYIAPEVLSMDYNEKCDIWSCGVILYILLSGYPPFTGKNDDEILAKVRLGKFNFSHPEFKQVSEESKSLIRKMLVMNTAQRISAIDALRDPWIAKHQQKSRISQAENTVLDSLHKLKVFRAETKLKQAVLTFIASQLVNEGQTKQMKDVFRALDSDGNGRLSKEELITAYGQSMPEDEACATVEAVMTKVDADKNGFIDYSEFILATMNEKVLLSKQNMEAAFRMFDKDGSGSITVAELKEMLGDETLASNAVWEQLIQQADQNGDGEIDLKEFKDLLVSIFA